MFVELNSSKSKSINLKQLCYFGVKLYRLKIANDGNNIIPIVLVAWILNITKVTEN